MAASVWLQPGELWVLVGFHAVILALLALDLGVFRRRAQAVTLRQAAAWSVLWILLALGFALAIWKWWPAWRPEHPEQAPQKAMEFVTGYLVELSLSVDNLFVFMVIFRYFGVPEHLRHRVLVWGILGAVLMRAGFIVAGAALLYFFHWLIYGFGLLLLYTAYQLSRSVEEEIDPGRNWLLRLGRRFLPLVDNYDSPRFWVGHQGRCQATPLFLVLLVIESTDLIFAVDSIPAVFGITRDPLIVYTSNIFAIIGLRSFYFLLAHFLGMFRYINVGIAVVLAFVGVKMLVEDPFEPLRWPGLEALLRLEKRHLIAISFAAIVLILAISVIASLWAGPKERLPHAPEAEAENPPPLPSPKIGGG